MVKSNSTPLNKQIYKSHRSMDLYRWHQWTNPLAKSLSLNIYLLVEQIDCSFNHGYIKYLALNLNNTNQTIQTNQSLLPTSKPVEYYTDKSNILHMLTIKANANTNINLIILKKLDILDIFKYKICYLQLPENFNAKISDILKTNQFYYVNNSNQKKLIQYNNLDTDETDNISDLFVNLIL